MQELCKGSKNYSLPQLMSIKRRLFETYIALMQTLLNRYKVQDTLHIHYSETAPTNGIDLISVAFNNLQVIQHQIRLVKKYIQDQPYTHIIVDNSSDPNKRKQIQALCHRKGITYISAPPIRLPLRPSYSHGAVLNWIYKHIVQTRRPAYFAFIDHDIFPTTAYSFIEKMGTQPFYGAKVQRGNAWYLWAGFCCFNRAYVQDKKLNFFPAIVNGEYLDTGGSNYAVLYQSADQHQLRFTLPREEQQLRAGSDYHADFIHLYDAAWLHTINGSYWKQVASKDDIIERILAQY